MTFGKNPKKMVKKGGKKKAVDPFSRKDWYEIRAPGVFKNRMVGYSLANRTIGTRIAADSLKGRVFEASMADLQKDEDQGTSVSIFFFDRDPLRHVGLT
jgi:small subunit ribosomal protein S3Ae